jgi:hypothetical protein
MTIILIPGIVSVCGLVVWAGESIWSTQRRNTEKSKRHERLIKRLHSLTLAEKKLLQEKYIGAKEKTSNWHTSDAGRISNLVADGARRRNHEAPCCF